MPVSNADSLPSHASPVIAPQPRPSTQYLASWSDLDNPSPSQPSTPGPPANLISPAFTPPLTPSLSQPGTPSRRHHEPKSVPVDTSLDALDPTIKQPRLLPKLPHVECLVRARIPTTTGAEMFLHLYANDNDNKEHLAIVFGNSIRSRSLDAERPGETEMDRMIRGAYVGRLRPGRTSSRRDDEEDLRRKVLRPDTKNHKRSGSALKNVETVPEDDNSHTLQTQQPTGAKNTNEHTPAQDERNAENTSTTSTPSYTPSSTPSIPSAPPSTPLPESKPPLVRIHSECYTGETAWSARCDCGEQLDEAARLMSTASATNPDPATTGGVIVYLRQEGRGIGLASKLKAYNLQDLGSDTVEANLLLRHPADARTYGLATAILVDLGLGADADADADADASTDTDAHDRGGEATTSNPTSTSTSTLAPPVPRTQGGRNRRRTSGIRLLTNNPEKVRAVEGPGREVRVVERVAMVPLSWRSGGAHGVRGEELTRYLETKIGRMGHMIHDS